MARLYCAGLLLMALAALSRLQAQPASATATPASAPQPLSAVHKICVDRIAGDESVVAAAREFAIAGLFSARRFIVTERCDKADAALKGAVIERQEKRVRAEGEATGFGVAGGGASVTGSSGSAGFGAARGDSGESLYSSETRATASVTLRLVDQEGTIIWAYTQDSPGGKTKSAVSDAIERAVRQLVRDIERSQHKPEAEAPK
jgi:hypothetical protein